MTIDQVDVTVISDDVIECVIAETVAVGIPIPGPGVPPGGDPGQVPVKQSTDDFDTAWEDPPSGLPPGGTTRQPLIKASDADLDAHWADLTADDVGAATPDDVAAAVATEAAARVAADSNEATTRATAVSSEAATRAGADTAEATARSNADALLIPKTDKGIANGVATLGADGKISATQVPAIAINDFLGNAGSQAAMLALTGQRGDWCIRTDTSGGPSAWILIHDDPTQLSSWEELPAPAGGSVIDVNGRSGHVTGLAEQTALDAETARAEAAESALSTDIGTEISDRTAAVSAEASSRSSGDSANATAISAEASARASADTAEASARASADSAEASTRAAADSALTTALGGKASTSHHTTHEDGGSDELALDASQITTGHMDPLRLGTTIPNGTKFLRDDGAWAFTQLGLSPLGAKSADWTANIGDYVPFDATAASRTLTLPTAPATGAVVGAKLLATASGHTLTIVTGGSDVIDQIGGATSLTLLTPGETIVLEYINSFNIWHVVIRGQSLTALDARYDAAGAAAAAIAALVNSSPVTLDTLKELADALGDDPNFATTITTLIGTKLAKSANLSDVANAVTALANLAGQPLDADLTAIAGFSSRDASHYLRGDGWRTFAQLLADLGLGNTALLNTITAGFAIPNDSLNKWKAGRGRAGTMLAGADAGSATAIPVYDLSIQPYAGVHRRLQIEDEETFTTANEATMTQIAGITSVASTGIFTKTAHGLIAGQLVSPDSGLLDSFLTVGGGYYVSATNLTANTFSLAITPTGAVLTGTTNDTALVLNTIVLTVATRGSVNWTGVPGSTTNLAGATSHATRSPVYAPMHKTVVHIGDSTVEGSDNEHPYQQNDSWSLRAARMLSERSGGLVAECWPYWRNDGTPASANRQDYHVVNPGSGLVVDDTPATHDVGWPGAVFVEGKATPNATQIVWTRPTYKRVEAIDFSFVDYGAAAVQWSYSVDGGTTWYDCPIASSNFVSGKGLLRRCRFLVDNPTDFRVRSCSAAGTAHTLVFPWVPIVTWSVSPHMATTEGVAWFNLGWPGALLSGFLNARVVHDAVPDGSGGLTSATAAFVANDVNSVIFVDGVAGTITARTNATTITTDTHFAAGSAKRLSILQGSGTGDWIAQFFGHHASWFPDLVILGSIVNDIASNEPDFYCDMLQFLITNLKPYCDVLVVSPYEYNGSTTVIQASYRSAIKAKAAANNCACLDLYDAMSAYGVTGFTAAQAAGYMIDNVHLSPLGNTWIGSHLARGLGLVA